MGCCDLHEKFRECLLFQVFFFFLPGLWSVVIHPYRLIHFWWPRFLKPNWLYLSLFGATCLSILVQVHDHSVWDSRKWAEGNRSNWPKKQTIHSISWICWTLHLLSSTTYTWYHHLIMYIKELIMQYYIWTFVCTCISPFREILSSHLKR